MATLAQPKPVPDFNLTLRGSDLWSKFGFNDSEILNEFLWFDPELEAFDNALYDKKDCTFFDNVALIALVEMFLLPKFDRPLTMHHASFLHNPAQVTEDEWWDITAYPGPELPEVEIEARTVMDMLYSLRSVFEAWIEEQPIAFPQCLRQTAAIFSELTHYPVVIDNNGPQAKSLTLTEKS